MNLDKNQMLLGGTSAAAVLMIVFGSFLNRTMGLPLGPIYGIAIALIVVVIALGASKVMSRGASKKRGDALGDEMERVTKKGTSADNESAQDASDVGMKVSEGIHQLREDGYNLGSFPFYLVIGEPKGGKTVACQALLELVGPIAPGMNNRYAGEGGTINLDFFFLQESVIIDTAGRMTFEDTPEWIELLDSLKRGRPDKPISGVMISVPADKLLLESAEAEQIREADATRLSAALKSIQNRLGVRFPVYVVVTKSDLIPGFREYFATTGAKGQAQIFGWSRAPKESAVKHVDAANEVLDRPYSREEMDRGLKSLSRSVQEQLLSQLADSKFKNKREASLFPSSFADASERLVEMVDQVFQAQARRTMRPFLRGVYFTSCKQTQPILSRLAERLGVPVNQLQAGQAGIAKEGHIPFFLKNLFQNRVLKESELVTSVDNLTRARKRALMQLAIAGSAALVLLIAAMVGGYRSLEKSVENDAKNFAALANGLGDNPFAPVPGRKSGGKPNLQLVSELMERVVDGFEIPLIYRPISWFSGTTGDRREALRQALGGKGGFFGELLTQCRNELNSGSKGSLGNDPFIERWFALAELVDLTDNPKPGAKPDSNQFPEGRQTNFTVVLVPAVTARATPGSGHEDHIDRFRRATDDYFRSELSSREGREFWTSFAATLSQGGANILNSSFGRFSNELTSIVTSYRPTNTLEKIAAAANRYLEYEKNLKTKGRHSKEEFTTLHEAMDGLGAPSFTEAYQKEAGNSIDKANSLLEKFRERQNNMTHQASICKAYGARIEAARTNLQYRAQTAAQIELYRALDKVLIGTTDPEGRRSYERRNTAYEAAGEIAQNLFEDVFNVVDVGTFVPSEWERKISADTRNSRDDEGLPEDPGQGIQVKRNIAKIREVALLDSVENSWAEFTRQVEELLNQTSDPSISLHDRLKALYVVLKSKFHDRGKYMQSYKVAANALAKRVDEGRANVAKAYVDKQVREFFKEVGFPLVARKASVSLSEDQIRNVKANGDKLLAELKDVPGVNIDAAKKDVEAIQKIATLLLGSSTSIDVTINTKASRFVQFQMIGITPKPGTSNIVVSRSSAPQTFPVRLKAGLRIAGYNNTDTAIESGVLVDQKNFGILHILAGANPPGEGTGVVVDLQSDKSTFRFEVGEESSFPFKDWYALSEKVPVN